MLSNIIVGNRANINRAKISRAVILGKRGADHARQAQDFGKVQVQPLDGIPLHSSVQPRPVLLWRRQTNWTWIILGA